MVEAEQQDGNQQLMDELRKLEEMAVSKFGAYEEQLKTKVSIYFIDFICPNYIQILENLKKPYCNRIIFRQD